MKSASAVSYSLRSNCEATHVKGHTMACSAFGNSPSRSWDCRRCHLFHGRTRIAGELSNGERSGSLTRTATRDSASLLYAARKHDCQLEHASRCRSIGPRRNNGWKEARCRKIRHERGERRQDWEYPRYHQVAFARVDRFISRESFAFHRVNARKAPSSPPLISRA